jgi:hypothetical protein
MSSADWSSGISLSNLVQGLPIFLSRFIKIIIDNINAPRKYPWIFDLKQASNYALTSIIIAFCLLLPSYITNDIPAAKWSLFVRLIVQYLVYGSIVTVLSNVFGKNKMTFSNGIAMYFHYCGTGSCLFLALSLPVTIEIGPQVVLGDMSNVDDIANMLAKSSLTTYMTIIIYLGAIVGIIIGAFWYSYAFGLWKIGVVIIMLISGFIGGFLQMFLIAPFFNRFENQIERIADVLA